MKNNNGLIGAWMALGISDADIVKLLALKSACERECEDVSWECIEVGLPSHGKEYELRCSAIHEHYVKEEDKIFSKYGF